MIGNATSQGTHGNGRLDRSPPELQDDLVGAAADRSPGRLVATSILWALVITGLARYGNGHLWVGFVLGLLLPITLWIACEGFWLP